MRVKPRNGRHMSKQGALARYDNDYRRAIKAGAAPSGSASTRLRTLGTASIAGLMSGLSVADGAIADVENFSKSYDAGTLKNILQLKGTMNEAGNYVVQTDSLDPQALAQLPLLAERGETEVPITMELINGSTQSRQLIAKNTVMPQGWVSDQSPDGNPIPFKEPSIDDQIRTELEKQNNEEPVAVATEHPEWKDAKPELQDKVSRAIQEANAYFEQFGISVDVHDVSRTVSQQQEMVRKGTSKTMNSKHLSGDAVDIVFKDKDGNWTWEPEGQGNVSDSHWQKLGEFIKAQGLEWGGDWTSIVDGPHAQLKKIK